MAHHHPRPDKRQMAQSKTAWMIKDTGEVIHTISSSSIEPANTEISSAAGFEVLCSYNWQATGKTILVPGGPPKWTPPMLPVMLPLDSGLVFVDQNAFRVPKYPFEPAFQALSVMNPNTRFDDVDIVVNRNSLRKLLDFAAGKKQDPFRMDLHVVKDTLFISRKEKNVRQMIHGSSNSGYGHNFEKAFTTPESGLGDSSSHHRVIRYPLGPLVCAVRFEVDAYYEADTTSEYIDQVTDSVQNLAMDEPQQTPAVQGSTQVIRKGTQIASSKLAEIKARKRERVGDALPQLWFGRTPYLLTGHHIEGNFQSVSCSHVGMQFTAWETENQVNLRKLVGLLAELRRVVLREMEERAAVLVCEQKGAPLKILQAKNGASVLPKEACMRYWNLAEAEAK